MHYKWVMDLQVVGAFRKVATSSLGDIHIAFFHKSFNIYQLLIKIHDILFLKLWHERGANKMRFKQMTLASLSPLFKIFFTNNKYFKELVPGKRHNVNINEALERSTCTSICSNEEFPCFPWVVTSELISRLLFVLTFFCFFDDVCVPL